MGCVHHAILEEVKTEQTTKNKNTKTSVKLLMTNVKSKHPSTVIDNYFLNFSVIHQQISEKIKINVVKSKCFKQMALDCSMRLYHRLIGPIGAILDLNQISDKYILIDCLRDVVASKYCCF